jgi:predicted RNA methylase
MTTAFPPCLNRNWRTLYRAAILESNKSVLPQRVSEAEQVVKARERELFYDNGTPEEGNGTSEEKEALEDALYALRAFRTAWQHTEAA